VRPNDPRMNRYEPPPLDELVGDVSPEVRAELADVDALLRLTPAPPPALPPSLREGPPAVQQRRGPLWTPRRVAVAFVAAAVLAAGFFGLGRWVESDDGFESTAAVAMQATKDAEGASAWIRLGPVDESGNQTVRLETSGLPELPDGGYYVLWLAQDGDYAATCGTFAVGEGDTWAEWTVSYDFRDYDTWVVTARFPDRDDDDPPWLLKAEI
jgi:Anti-sigma-K factor rskA